MRFALASLAGAMAAGGHARGELATWANSTVGIHAFLTFDSEAASSSITAFGDRIDYVWGAASSKVAEWRASSNPNVILSKYIPFTRDPGTPILNGTGPTASALPWWQAHHPALVLYQCDRQTPAWECFAGEGCVHHYVPLDLTNPATLDYQMTAGVQPAAKAGFNAIALDNYDLRNSWGGCGAFKGPGGAWVQLYDNEHPKADPKYEADVLNWTRRAVARIHAEAGMLVIPNFSDMSFSAGTLAVANATDGLLAEAGFTMWDPVPNTTSMTTLPPKTTPGKFEAQVQFVRNLQRHGKGFFGAWHTRGRRASRLLSLLALSPPPSSLAYHTRLPHSPPALPPHLQRSTNGARGQTTASIRGKFHTM
jgi:hypothetical protein